MSSLPANLLVSTPANIRHLSGFTGEGLALLLGRKKILLTDSRYSLRARDELKSGWRLEIMQPGQDSLRQILAESGAKELGFEARDISVARLANLKKRLRGIRLTPTENAIESRRQVKSAAEIAAIEKACEIGDRVLKSIIPAIRRGVTEAELAENIRAAAFRFGAEGLAFDTIVAFGENSAMPHAHPGQRKLKKGDLIQFDLGVRTSGYCSDMSRVFFTAEPTPIQQQVFDAVLAAQLAGVAAIRPGIPAAQVDAACRAELAEAGMEDFFTHSTGHGVGLDIHEWPSLSPHSTDSLAAGNIVTVEPGVYLDGLCGMRIEDTVAVERAGGRVLTRFPKRLAILRI